MRPPADTLYGGGGGGGTEHYRLNSSQSYASALGSRTGAAAPYNDLLDPMLPPQGAAAPRKQSTSFENVEPTTSSLTRIPWRGGGGGGGSSGSEDWTEMTVFLTRQDNGFGFRIIGGTEEGSQVSGFVEDA